jgi:two-component system nitrate/nitrite response regulator NarL
LRSGLSPQSGDICAETSKAVGIRSSRPGTVAAGGGWRLETRAFKVFIFSEHAIYCESLRILLDAAFGFRIVGSTTEWTRAVNLVRASRPDVILLDLHTPLVPRSSVVAALLAACPSARTIVLAPRLEKRELSETLRLGIRGVVLKGVNADVFYKSIRAVAAGEYWIDREIFVGLVQTLSTNETERATGSNDRRFGLTKRELEIVSTVLGGSPNKQIARQCGISEKTVKQHLTNIFDKVGLSNRLELAVFALEHQLVARTAGSSDRSAEAR